MFDFLVLIYAFIAPGSSTRPIGVYRNSECRRHMLYFHVNSKLDGAAGSRLRYGPRARRRLGTHSASWRWEREYGSSINDIIESFMSIVVPGDSPTRCGNGPPPEVKAGYRTHVW